jgi:hypothetical protein
LVTPKDWLGQPLADFTARSKGCFNLLRSALAELSQ